MVARKSGGHLNITCENAVWLAILQWKAFIFFILMSFSCNYSDFTNHGPQRPNHAHQIDKVSNFHRVPDSV